MIQLDQRSCVGPAVRVLRERRGLSARALSLQAGLSPAYVFKLETGQVEPSLRCFGRLALVLGMTHEEIWVCMAVEAAHGSSIAPAGAATHGGSGGN